MPHISITRHQEIFNPAEFSDIPIHIIGAGATGSRVWLSLVELGLTNITVYDFDKVEPHNLANQIFFNEDIGKRKVFALADYYRRKTGHEPHTNMRFINAKVSAATFGRGSMPGIVFLLTDTMSSRRDIFENVIYHAGGGHCPTPAATTYMIETRMASSYGNIFGVNPFDPAERAYWISTLVDDEADSTEVSACGTSISVGPTASIIANMAVWQMIMFLNDPLAATTEINLFCKPMVYHGRDIQRNFDTTQRIAV